MSKSSNQLKAEYESGINLNAQDAQKLSLLHYGVQLNDLDLVRQLVDYGVSLNLQEVNGKTVFFSACSRKQSDIAEYLLSKSSDPSIVGGSLSEEDVSVLCSI